MKTRRFTRVDFFLMLGLAVLFALLAYLGVLHTPSAGGAAITWMPNYQ